MEQKEEEHITQNLSRLIEWTECNSILLAKLVEKNVISKVDREEIVTHRTEHKRAETLYYMLTKRSGSYTVLLNALKQTKQSGAAAILESLQSKSCLANEADIAVSVDEMFYHRAKKSKTEDDEEKTETVDFDVNPPVYLFTGRNEELQELHEKLNQSHNSCTVVSQIASISGLGGIGKTELSKKYIQVYRKTFNHVIWVDAEREDTIRASFLRLAKDRLGIKTKDADGGDKDVVTIVQEVYAYFSNKNGTCLIVFDNAENNETFHRFLRLRSAASHAKLPFVLITSRDKDWPADMEIIPLDEMKFEDAIEFVKRAIPSEAEKIQEIKNLAECLQCFPLALQQAVAYVNEKRKRNSGYSIASYLQELPSKKKILLNSTKFQGLFNDYRKTTYSTWTLTIQAIASDEEHGVLSRRILHSISYFSADKIPSIIFLDWANGSHDDLDEAVGLLVKYSMVKEDPKQKDLLSIHRLVQDVIQIQLEDELLHGKVLLECLELFQPEIRPDYVEHGVSIWNHASKHKNLVEIHSSLPAQLVKCLIGQRKYDASMQFATETLKLLTEVLGDIHKDVWEVEKIIAEVNIAIGKYDIGIDGYKKLILKLRSYENCPESDCLLMEHQIGRILARQAKYEDALTCMSNAAEKRGALFGKNNVEYVDCVKSQIFVLMNIGNYKLALEYADHVLEDYKRLLGEDSLKVLATIQDYAVVHAEMGNLEKAISILKDTYEKLMVKMGQENYYTIMCGHNLAVFLRRHGRNSESYDLFNVIYEITKNVEGPDHPETIVTLEAMAEVSLNMKQYDQALGIFLEVYAAHSEQFGEESYKTLDSRFKVACALSKKGDSERALYILKNLVKLLTDKLGEKHVRVWKAKVEIAKILENQKDFIGAFNVLENVKSLYGKTLSGSVIPPIVVEALALTDKIVEHLEAAI